MSKTDITSEDGQSFFAYVAEPDGTGPAPGLVLIQEIFGVNADMRAKADQFAALGYLVMVPDLFFRQEPGVELTDKSQAEWDRAFELFNGFDVDWGVKDIASTVAALRAHPRCNGKVGASGYCLGGLLAYLTAARVDVEAAVGYYGVNIPAFLAESGNIKGQLMLHVPTEDGFVDKDAQKAMHDGLDPLANVIVFDYEGQDHAFARENGEHYDAAAASLANDRTAAFLETHLKAA